MPEKRDKLGMGLMIGKKLAVVCRTCGHKLCRYVPRSQQICRMHFQNKEANAVEIVSYAIICYVCNSLPSVSTQCSQNSIQMDELSIYNPTIDLYQFLGTCEIGNRSTKTENGVIVKVNYFS